MTHDGARRCMQAALQGRAHLLHPALRAVGPSDVEALAHLMLQAYRGTIDDEGETLSDALTEVQRTCSGGYGAFDADASCVAEVQGRLVSAVLVTRHQGGPWVAFTMTAPPAGRMGWARRCLASAIAVLAARGERHLRLVVTVGNLPAVALYRGLGFEFEL